jgi:hypothetical protein
MQFLRWIPGDLVGFHRVINGGRDSMQFPQSIPWGPGLVGAAGRDSMHNLGSQGQHDAQPWIHGDLVGVSSSDQHRPGQQQQSPSGRYSMQFLRWIPWDLVGFPSSDQRRPGQQQQSPAGRYSMQFPRWIPWDLVGAARRYSMHNHGSQGTWLEFHRAINADRASMMQSPAGRDSMQFPQ